MASLIRVLTCGLVNPGKNSPKHNEDSRAQAHPAVAAMGRRRSRMPRQISNRLQKSSSNSSSVSTEKNATNTEPPNKRHSHIFSHILHHQRSPKQVSEKQVDQSEPENGVQPWRPSFNSSQTSLANIRAKNRAKSVGGYISNLNIPLVNVSTTSIQQQKPNICAWEQPEGLKSNSSQTRLPNGFDDDSSKSVSAKDPEMKHFSSPETVATLGTTSPPAITPPQIFCKKATPISAVQKNVCTLDNEDDCEDYEDIYEGTQAAAPLETYTLGLPTTHTLKNKKSMSSRRSRQRKRRSRHLSADNQTIFDFRIPAQNNINLPSPYAHTPPSPGTPKHHQFFRKSHHSRYRCKGKTHEFVNQKLRYGSSKNRKNSLGYSYISGADNGLSVGHRYCEKKTDTTNSKSKILSPSYIIDSVRNSSSKPVNGEIKTGFRDRIREKIGLGENEKGDGVPMITKTDSFLITDDDVRVKVPEDESSWSDEEDNEDDVINKYEYRDTASDKENDTDKAKNQKIASPELQRKPYTSAQQPSNPASSTDSNGSSTTVQPSRRGRFSFTSLSRQGSELSDSTTLVNVLPSDHAKSVSYDPTNSHANAVEKSFAGISNITSVTTNAVAVPLIKRASSTKREIVNVLCPDGKCRITGHRLRSSSNNNPSNVSGSNNLAINTESFEAFDNYRGEAFGKYSTISRSQSDNAIASSSSSNNSSKNNSSTSVANSVNGSEKSQVSTPKANKGSSSAPLNSSHVSLEPPQHSNSNNGAQKSKQRPRSITIGVGSLPSQHDKSDLGRERNRRGDKRSRASLDPEILGVENQELESSDPETQKQKYESHNSDEQNNESAYFGYQLPTSLKAAIASWIPSSLTGYPEPQSTGSESNLDEKVDLHDKDGHNNNSSNVDEVGPEKFKSTKINRRHTEIHPTSQQLESQNRRKTGTGIPASASFSFPGGNGFYDEKTNDEMSSTNTPYYNSKHLLNVSNDLNVKVVVDTKLGSAFGF